MGHLDDFGPVDANGELRATCAVKGFHTIHKRH